MFNKPNVQQTHVFNKPYVQQTLCSTNPMFDKPYVLSALEELWLENTKNPF